jgi:hypothetical protein
MIFDIDAEMAFESVIASLEDAASYVTEEQFANIVNDINESLPGVIQVLAQGMSEHWRAEAREAGGWGEKYARAIKYKTTDDTAEIYLDEDLIDPGSKKPYFMFAMMMEEGVNSWSIKDAVLKSEKAKMSQDGIRYIIIPFPVAAPREPRQGKMQSRYGKREMSRDMYSVVKSGGRLKTGSIQAYGKEVDVSGLIKYQTRKFHGQYGIFRVVTQDSTGWQYPSVPPEPVYPAVLQEVNRQINELLKEFCSNVVREYSE